jgi:hypothetical protein
VLLLQKKIRRTATIEPEPRYVISMGSCANGAILLVSVPATIMTSDWRGEERGAKPKRSMSYRGIDTCIISIAQQASPNSST